MVDEWSAAVWRNYDKRVQLQKIARMQVQRRHDIGHVLLGAFHDLHDAAGRL